MPADDLTPCLQRIRHVDAYCGAVKRHTLGVDLVTGSLMTTAPDVQTPTPALNLRDTSPTTTERGFEPELLSLSRGSRGPASVQPELRSLCGRLEA